MIGEQRSPSEKRGLWGRLWKIKNILDVGICLLRGGEEKRDPKTPIKPLVGQSLLRQACGERVDNNNRI